MTATMSHTEIQARIVALESTERALIGSDEGTHGESGTYRMYEEITGDRYAVYSFAGRNGTRCTIGEAVESTVGRMNWFSNSQSDIRAAQAELKALRKQLRNAK